MADCTPIPTVNLIEKPSYAEPLPAPMPIMISWPLVLCDVIVVVEEFMVSTRPVNLRVKNTGF
jgi:hypothetical protein